MLACPTGPRGGWLKKVDTRNVDTKASTCQCHCCQCHCCQCQTAASARPQRAPAHTKRTRVVPPTAGISSSNISGNSLKNVENDLTPRMAASNCAFRAPVLSRVAASPRVNRDLVLLWRISRRALANGPRLSLCLASVWALPLIRTAMGSYLAS